MDLRGSLRDPLFELFDGAHLRCDRGTRLLQARPHRLQLEVLGFEARFGCVELCLGGGEACGRIGVDQGVGGRSSGRCADGEDSLPGQHGPVGRGDGFAHHGRGIDQLQVIGVEVVAESRSNVSVPSAPFVLERSKYHSHDENRQNHEVQQAEP